MEKRIELERRGRSPSQISELNLDNCKSSSVVVGLDEKWERLTSLSLCNSGLTSLKDFPKLPSLLKLDISDNCITGGLHHLSALPALSFLSLSNTKIATLDGLQPLKDVTTLNNLELINCPVSNIENYREKVFQLLPNLIYLDGYDKNGVDIDDDGEVNSSLNMTNGHTNGDRVEDSESEDVEEEEEDDDAGGPSSGGKHGGKRKEEAEEDEDCDLEDDEVELSDEEESEDDDGEDVSDVPLRALYESYDPEGDDDYEGVEEEEEEDLDEEDEEEGGGGRGKKRKFEDAQE